MNGTFVQAILDNIFYLLPIRIIHSYEKGVLFKKGKDVAELGPGVHFFIPWLWSIEVINAAPEVQNLPTQSVTSKDRQTVAFSCNICYQVVDARKMFTQVQSFDDAIEGFAMVHLAEMISQHTVIQYHAKRESLHEQFAQTLSEKVEEWGAKMIWVGLTDYAVVKAYRLFGDGLLR